MVTLQFAVCSLHFAMTLRLRPHIVLGVTGSIAAYKALELVRRLQDRGAVVSVVMTESAQKLMMPLSFESVAGGGVFADMWVRRTTERRETEDGGSVAGRRSPVAGRRIEHIDLARSAQLLLVAPATANIIGKVAGGIADDLLSTVIMATRAPVVFAPAMNDMMWTNPIVRDNVARLKALGYGFVEPETGALACGTEGTGRLAAIDTICEAVWDRLEGEPVLAGRRVIVTAGRTEEEIDPVRVLTNRSSGRMGFALASASRRAGAKVTIVAGRTSVPLPAGIEVVPVTTTDEMLAAVRKLVPEADVLFMAAAPSDFRPATRAANKRKDTSLMLEVVRTPDILTELKQLEHHALLVGFSIETRNALANARKKLQAKGLDIIVANPVKTLDDDSVEATLVFKGGEPRRLARQSKADFAANLVREVSARLQA
jgi:phosphopantothenoylcysteine decarboxylase/phosphopantothenate--cysteine ligase